MGTPDFAVPVLSRLIETGHDIAAVFSQPDSPSGRGRKLVPTPAPIRHGGPCPPRPIRNRVE